MGALFVNDIEDYKIDVEPFGQAREQLLKYIEKTYKKTGEEANALFKEMLKEREVKDPIITFVNRKDCLDKEEDSTTLLSYIEDYKNNSSSMTPSFTCYDRKEETYQGLFIQDGLINRSTKKKEAAKCESSGDKLGFLINNLLQKAFKLRNNSLSGAYLSMSTLFYNPSSHTALTSTTRLAASVANMLTESMVEGRRLYKDPESVLNHFLALLTNTDKKEVEEVHKIYNLKYPSIKDVMNMVDDCIADYWSNPKYYENIQSFVSNLDDVERSIVLHTYDIYNLEKTNKDFVRNMMNGLSKQYTGISSDISLLENYDEFIINIVHHICFGSLKGKGKDYREFPKNLKDLIVSTTIMLDKNIKKYSKYIDVFLKSNVMPINIAFIKDMIMEAVSHSDTDSTCGWYGNRVNDRFGNIDMTEKNIGYFSVYMMFNSGAVSHLLRQLTANLNVAVEKRDKLAMKNEYYFPVFGSGNVTKHYIANIALKEGLVYDKEKLEVKGNSLIVSNNTQYIRDNFTSLVEEITETLGKGERLDSEKIIKHITDLERYIVDKVKSGDGDIFKLEKINTTYKVMKTDPSKWIATNIFHQRLYREVFSSTYGKEEELPYLGVSIPLKKGNLLEMIEEIEDIEIREKFKTFLEENPKKGVERIIYPLSIISKKGLPKELLNMVDMHKLVATLVNAHYILLEILGIYIKENSILSDYGY